MVVSNFADMASPGPHQISFSSGSGGILYKQEYVLYPTNATKIANTIGINVPQTDADIIFWKQNNSESLRIFAERDEH